MCQPILACVSVLQIVNDVNDGRESLIRPAINSVSIKMCIQFNLVLTAVLIEFVYGQIRRMTDHDVSTIGSFQYNRNGVRRSMTHKSQIEFAFAKTIIGVVLLFCRLMMLHTNGTSLWVVVCAHIPHHIERTEVARRTGVK